MHQVVRLITLGRWIISPSQVSKARIMMRIFTFCDGKDLKIIEVRNYLMPMFASWILFFSGLVGLVRYRNSIEIIFGVFKSVEFNH